MPALGRRVRRRNQRHGRVIYVLLFGANHLTSGATAQTNGAKELPTGSFPEKPWPSREDSD
jgi:hypothetical protein